MAGLDPSTLASLVLAGVGSAAGHVLSDQDPWFGATGAVFGAALGFLAFRKASTGITLVMTKSVMTKSVMTKSVMT